MACKIVKVGIFWCPILNISVLVLFLFSVQNTSQVFPHRHNAAFLTDKKTCHPLKRKLNNDQEMYSTKLKSKRCTVENLIILKNTKKVNIDLLCSDWLTTGQLITRCFLRDNQGFIRQLNSWIWLPGIWERGIMFWAPIFFLTKRYPKKFFHLLKDRRMLIKTKYKPVQN